MVDLDAAILIAGLLPGLDDDEIHEIRAMFAAGGSSSVRPRRRPVPSPPSPEPTPALADDAVAAQPAPPSPPLERPRLDRSTQRDDERRDVEMLESGFYATTSETGMAGAGPTSLELRASDEIDLAGTRGTPPPTPPLFEDRAARVRVAALLRRLRRSHELNVAAVVLARAQGDVLIRIPFVRRPTIGGSIVFAVERSGALAPFDADVRQLRASVRSVAPHVTVIESRRRGGTPSMLPPRLPIGTVALVYTDFALGSPSMGSISRPPGDWARFARACRAAGGSVTFLSPYPPREAPQVASGLAVVHWSDSLSVRACARQRQR